MTRGEQLKRLTNETLAAHQSLEEYLAYVAQLTKDLDRVQHELDDATRTAEALEQEFINRSEALQHFLKHGEVPA